MIWKPNVTVAAVIERDNKFLLVEEHTSQGLMLNQPAGHLEEGESLIAAVMRETMEESAYSFEPQYLIGVYRWHSPTSNTTYLRFAFCGHLLAHHPERALDKGIERTMWMSLREIHATQHRHRSPLIVRCIEDYLAGKRYPLDIITHYD
jgi:8-oxo-dGTP pyrophosphatase MutT (NUDIX family)